MKVLFGIVLGWIVTSLIESLSHRYMQHASPRLRTFYDRYPKLLGYSMRRAFRSHALVHHGRTFKESQVTRFHSDEDRQALDKWLIKNNFDSKTIIADQYGTTLSLFGILQFLLPFAIVMIPVGLLLPTSVGIPFLSSMFICPMLSKYLHPYMHVSVAEGIKTAPYPIRLMLKSVYGRWAWRHHWIHHRRSNSKNFNLMIGGDWLLGVHSSPTNAELDLIRDMGGP